MFNWCNYQRTTGIQLTDLVSCIKINLYRRLVQGKGPTSVVPDPQYPEMTGMGVPTGQSVFI